MLRIALLADPWGVSEQVQLAICTGVVTVLLALISSWRLRLETSKGSRSHFLDETTSGSLTTIVGRQSP